MAAFVGFCVQSNGIVFPWDSPATAFRCSDRVGRPGDQWDALPTSAKLQILGFVGFEMLSETPYFPRRRREGHDGRQVRLPLSRYPVAAPVLLTPDPVFTKKMANARTLESDNFSPC